MQNIRFIRTAFRNFRPRIVHIFCIFVPYRMICDNGIQEVRGSIPLISTTNLQQKSVPIGHGLLLRYGDFGAGAVAEPPPPASLAHRCRRNGERLPWLCRGDGQPSPRMRRKLPSEARAGDFRMVMAHCIYRRLNGSTGAIKKCIQQNRCFVV